MKSPKIFCVGMHKTGTTSVSQVLQELGYTLQSWVPTQTRAQAVQLIDRMLLRYDMAKDHPWALMFKELDQKCPDSKFILTVRHSESWFASLLNAFGHLGTAPMRQWIYGPGNPQGNKDIYIARFERHNREVQEYFADKPQSLLVLDLLDGHVWKKIAQFLQLPIPTTPFPHANKSAEYDSHRSLAL